MCHNVSCNSQLTFARSTKTHYIYPKHCDTLGIWVSKKSGSSQSGFVFPTWLKISYFGHFIMLNDTRMHARRQVLKKTKITVLTLIISVCASQKINEGVAIILSLERQAGDGWKPFPRQHSFSMMAPLTQPEIEVTSRERPLQTEWM